MKTVAEMNRRAAMEWRGGRPNMGLIYRMIGQKRMPVSSDGRNCQAPDAPHVLSGGLKKG